MHYIANRNSIHTGEQPYHSWKNIVSSDIKNNDYLPFNWFWYLVSNAIQIFKCSRIFRLDGYVHHLLLYEQFTNFKYLTVPNPLKDTMLFT